MSKKLQNWQIILFVVLLLSATGVAAQDPGGQQEGQGGQAQQGGGLIPDSGILAPGCDFVTGEFHFHCVPIYVGYLVKFLFGFAAGMCIFNITRGGYQIVLGGLSGEKESGKNRITWAIIGLVFSILSFAMVDIVVSALL